MTLSRNIVSNDATTAQHSEAGAENNNGTDIHVMPKAQVDEGLFNQSEHRSIEFNTSLQRDIERIKDNASRKLSEADNDIISTSDNNPPDPHKDSDSSGKLEKAVKHSSEGIETARHDRVIGSGDTYERSQKKPLHLLSIQKAKSKIVPKTSSRKFTVSSEERQSKPQHNLSKRKCSRALDVTTKEVLRKDDKESCKILKQRITHGKNNQNILKQTCDMDQLAGASNSPIYSSEMGETGESQGSCTSVDTASSGTKVLKTKKKRKIEHSYFLQQLTHNCDGASMTKLNPNSVNKGQKSIDNEYTVHISQKVGTSNGNPDDMDKVTKKDAQEKDLEYNNAHKISSKSDWQGNTHHSLSDIINGIKFDLYFEATQVHHGRNSDQLFRVYWNTLGKYLSSGIHTQEDIQTDRKSLDGILGQYLKTDWLKKLHNKLVLALMKATLTSECYEHKFHQFIPSHWKRLVKDIVAKDGGAQTEAKKKDITKYQSLSWKNAYDIQRSYHEYGRTSEVWTAHGHHVENMHPSLESLITDLPHFDKKLFVPKTGKNLNLSSNIPGALDIIPAIREVYEQENVSISSAAIWGIILAVKEYIILILKSTISKIHLSMINQNETKCSDMNINSDNQIHPKVISVIELLQTTNLEAIGGSRNMSSSRLASEHLMSTISSKSFEKTSPALEGIQSTLLGVIEDSITSERRKNDGINRSLPRRKSTGLGAGKDLSAMRARLTGNSDSKSLNAKTIHGKRPKVDISQKNTVITSKSKKSSQAKNSSGAKSTTTNVSKISGSSKSGGRGMGAKDLAAMRARKMG